MKLKIHFLSSMQNPYVFLFNQSLPCGIPVKFSRFNNDMLGPEFIVHVVASSGTTKRRQPLRKTALDQQFLDNGTVDANEICISLWSNQINSTWIFEIR